MDGLLVIRWGGLGDVLMTLQALSAIKTVLKIPVFLATHPNWFKIAQAAQIDGVYIDYEQALTGSRQFLLDKGLEKPELNVLNWSSAHHGVCGQHQVLAFIDTIKPLVPANKFAQITPEKIKLTLSSNASLSRIEPWLINLHKAPKIVLHPNVGDENRTWPLEFWQRLADACLSCGDNVLIIGQNTYDKSVFGNINSSLNLVNQLSLLETHLLLQRCDILISGDSGPVQLVGATDINLIALYSTVKAVHRLPWRHGSIFYKNYYVEPNCPYAGCYDLLHSGQQRDNFAERTGIPWNDLHNTFAKWCKFAENPYRCVQEATTLERVLQARETIVGN